MRGRDQVATARRTARRAAAGSARRSGSRPASGPGTPGRCCGARRRARATTSCPATSASPEVGLASVQSMLIVVVLPAPLGPRKPNTSPVGDLEADAAHRLDLAVVLDEVRGRRSPGVARVAAGSVVCRVRYGAEACADRREPSRQVLRLRRLRVRRRPRRLLRRGSRTARAGSRPAARWPGPAGLVTDRRDLPGRLADAEHERSELGQHGLRVLVGRLPRVGLAGARLQVGAAGVGDLEVPRAVGLASSGPDPRPRAGRASGRPSRGSGASARRCAPRSSASAGSRCGAPRRAGAAARGGRRRAGASPAASAARAVARTAAARPGPNGPSAPNGPPRILRSAIRFSMSSGDGRPCRPRPPLASLQTHPPQRLQRGFECRHGRAGRPRDRSRDGDDGDAGRDDGPAGPRRLARGSLRQMRCQTYR